MTMDSILQLYSTGVCCGVLLSFLPFIIGELIGFALKMVKGG